ncbi:unnamed protein product [Mytilus edulis]|uniref:CARD domain-containing protein n=1 Tax=Mytilus edulis TaxID=6550 RepID=A0A8S3QRB2_MYTED|nr:unnamed protein product [Mytilus edulis]
MVDVIQWLNPLETMAESLGQSNPVADSGCSFSSHCGRNVIVDGPTARWNSFVSGGRVVVDKPISPEADKESSVTVGRNDKVWVTVNIIFGDLEIEIETEGYNFSNKTGGNIQLENNDTWANLKFPNPCAVCFVGNLSSQREALNFQIDPILRDGKPSRNFSIKIAISQSNPVNLMSGNDTYDDITSLPVIHFDEFPKKCKNEIKIRLSQNGTVQITSEKGTLNKETNNDQIYCIFELCRIKLHCKSKIVDFSPSVETASPIDQVDTIVVPPDSEYFRSKKMLESIRYDAESISIHSNDFNPAMESRNIVGDVSPLLVNNGSNINNPAEYRIRSNEALSPVYNISPSHNKEELNLRLQTVEETIGIRETGEKFMRQSQYEELKSEIQTIKKILSEIQSSGQPPTIHKTSTEKSVETVLQKNYVILIKMIEAVPLLDLLYASDCISHNDCERLGKLFQSERENANRELLNIIIRRQSIDLDYFESLLFESKQIGVLAVLFPDKYGKKKIKSMNNKLF